MKLQVVENQGRLVFKNIVTGSPDHKLIALEKLLRSDLPKQVKLHVLPLKLASIWRMSAARPGIKPTLSNSISNQINILQNSLPAAKHLVNPQLLKKTIDDSGLFLEAKLAANTQRSGNSALSASTLDTKFDLKANLLRLSEAIEHSLKALTPENRISSQRSFSDTSKHVAQNFSRPNGPSNSNNEILELVELRNIVESAVSRIQVNQSQAIVSMEHAVPTWIIELPLTDTGDENAL